MRESIERISVIVLITTFMGQIYISPVQGAFRLSLAVTILSLLLIYLNQTSVMAVCALTAISVPLFRAFVQYVTLDVTYWDSLMHFYPASIYYLLFGLLFLAFNIRGKIDKPILLIVSLWICDVVPNMAEAAYRSTVDGSSFDALVVNIILVGLMRTLLTYLLYLVTLYVHNRYERIQNAHKYRETLLFMASLKTELFILNKSSRDIEKTMQMSYDLYLQAEKPFFKEQTLTIAKNIHEIKKDYQRVISGMERVITSELKNGYMTLSEILEIIKDNADDMILTQKKEITVYISRISNFKTNNFYGLISILNNLMTNAIDAIEVTGQIQITEYSSSEAYHFKVVDTGNGIDAEARDLIFEPGFSTKYDQVTGHMYTGLGLSHVKQIVENQFGGIIQLDAPANGKGATFVISIPKDSIEVRF